MESFAFVAVLAGAFLTGTLLMGAVLWAATGEWVLFSSGGTRISSTAEGAARTVFTAALLPVPFLVVRLASQRPWGTLLSVSGRIRWRWLAACTVLAVECVILGFAMSAVLKGAFTDEPPLPPWHSWESFRGPLLESLPATVLIGVVLELYRIWIMQTVGAHTLQRADGGRRRGVAGLLGKALRTPWPAITAGAALHLPFAFSNGQEVKVDVFFFFWFCLLGWLVVRTGGVEAVLAFLVISGALTHVFDIASGEYPAGTDMPYLYSIGAPLLGLVFFTPFVLWLRQLMDVAVVTPPPAAGQAGGLGLPAPKT